MWDIGARDVGSGTIGDGEQRGEARARLAALDLGEAVAQTLGDDMRHGLTGLACDGPREAVSLGILDVEARAAQLVTSRKKALLLSTILHSGR